MKVGVVTGPVWATKKCDSLVGHALLVVKTDNQLIVADDLVGAGVGDTVLVSLGSGARQETPGTPVDAAIVGILDQTEEFHVHQ